MYCLVFKPSSLTWLDPQWQWLPARSGCKTFTKLGHAIRELGYRHSVGFETHQELGLTHAVAPPGHELEDFGFQANFLAFTPSRLEHKRAYLLVCWPKHN